MQALSDYLYSIFIAGVILLIVLSLKFRGEATAIDATQYRAAKIGSLSLIESIERDFTNMGSQHPTGTLKPEDAIVAWDTLGTPSYMVFWAQTDSTQAARRVCYSWQTIPNKTVQLKSGVVPLYEVERKVDVAGNCTGGTREGMNTNMITMFEIHLSMATVDPYGPDSLRFTNYNGPSADVQQIHVKLRGVSPLGPGDAIEEIRWEKVFRPVNLWKRREV